MREREREGESERERERESERERGRGREREGEREREREYIPQIMYIHISDYKAYSIGRYTGLSRAIIIC